MKLTGGYADPDFKCQMCGSCCQGDGDLYILDSEIQVIAKYLSISEEEFIQKYTRLARNRSGLSLTDRENKRCVFLDHRNLCEINAVKPEQCRTFPQVWSYDGWNNECLGCIQKSRVDSRQMVLAGE